MQHLEGSGTPVLYIGRKVLKGYLHIIHLLKSSTCFEHYPAHLQEVYVVILYMQPLVSSLSVKSELSKTTAL